MQLETCKHLNHCNNGENNSCEGCNVYNMLYNENALIDWCKQQKVSVVKTIIDLHRDIGMMLVVEEDERNDRA